MNPMLQPGTHPDAEILTSFVEQSVSDAEREQVLAHMGVCSRCREVVFLAQKAAGEKAPAPIAVAPESRQSISRGWFTGWRWAWVPVAALAGFVGFAVVQHVRSNAGSPSQVARNVPPAETMQGASPSQASTQGSQQPSTPSAAKRSPRRGEQDSETPSRDKGLSASNGSAKALDEKDTMLQKKEDSPRPVDSVIATNQGVLAGGAGQATIAGRAKSSPLGGPMAQNEYQQNNAVQASQQNALQYDSRQQVSGSLDSSNKPKPAAPVAHTAMTTVQVQAEQQPALASAAMKPVPQAAVPSATDEIAVDSALKRARSSNLKLPSKLQVLSQAALGRRMIVLDTAGALFSTDDAGEHWQPVTTQWTGSAVLVKAQPVSGRVTGNLLDQKPGQFELVTDKLETWTSTDGKTWTQANLPK